MSMKYRLLCLAAVVSTQDATATIVHRCTGLEGQVAFTYGACPDGQPGDPQRAWNPPPGSVAPAGKTRELPSSKAPLSPAVKAVANTTAERPEAKAREKAKKKQPAKYTPWR